MRALLATLLLLGLLGLEAQAGSKRTLPPDVAKALHDAQRVELYSLEPWFDPDAAKQEAMWHDFVLLGHTTLSKEDSRIAVAEFEAAIEKSAGGSAACFDPRHAMSFVSAGHKYDILLCYECGGLAVYRDDEYLLKVGAEGSPAVLNRLLAKAEVPLSKSGSD
jgi:hypothetical protein